MPNVPTVYSAAITPSNDLEEVGEEIHACVRLAHPGFSRASLPDVIDSVNEFEVVESRRSNVF